VSDPFRELVFARFKAIDRETRLREKAIEVARAEMNRRLDQMNEFREQLKDQERTYVTKVEFSPSYQQVEKRIASLERLVYIGFGAALIVNALLVYFMTKH
jgi:hypothetical protein